MNESLDAYITAFKRLGNQLVHNDEKILFKNTLRLSKESSSQTPASSTSSSQKPAPIRIKGETTQRKIPKEGLAA